MSDETQVVFKIPDLTPDELAAVRTALHLSIGMLSSGSEVKKHFVSALYRMTTQTVPKNRDTHHA